MNISINTLSYQQSIDRVIEWAKEKRKAYICFANVHMSVEAYRNQRYAQIINKANLVLPDGKPIAIVNSWLNKKSQERISGMDFLESLLHQSHPVRLFIYGSTEEVIAAFRRRVENKHPHINIAGHICPPFRALTNEEAEQDTASINAANPDIVLVALGCPKQEKWMAKHTKNINAVLLGIGAALEVSSGRRKRAPLWMQQASLEWLFRLVQEPRRLFKRYLVTNTFFMYLLVKHYLLK